MQRRGSASPFSPPAARSRVGALCLAAGLCVWAGAARAESADTADPAPKVREQVSRLEVLVAELGRQLNQLSVSHVNPQLNVPQYELQTRLNDAQVAYFLRDYLQASIIFFDIVEAPRNRTQPVFEEALYYLADSLYQNRNFLAARRYFGELLQSYPRSKYYQDALTKVVSMALITGRHEEVDTFYARLVQGTSTQAISPEIPYLYAKSLYTRAELERAFGAFASIPQASPYFVRSRFFMGGILARQKKYAEAVKVFLELYKIDPASSDLNDYAERQKLITINTQLVEMTHLALGRLYFDLGDLERASAAFQEVNRKSDVFPEALYELAWTWIKGKQYEKARRALEILMLSRIDSQTLPESQVLLGDLQLLLDRPEDATKTYQAVKNTFEPVRRELQEAIARHADPVRYFNSLLAGKIDRMDPSAMLPPVATKWAQTGERVGTAMQVVRDLGASRDQLTEAKKIVTRLEAALGAKDKLEMFPLLRDARASSLELENKLLRAKMETSFLESLLLRDQVSPDEKASIEAAKTARLKVHEEFRTIPLTKESYLKRRDQQKQMIASLEGEAHKLGVQIDGIKAQLVAAVKYWQDTRKRKQVSPQDEQAVFARIDAEKVALAELSKSLEAAQVDLNAARARAGVGDEAVANDDLIRRRFNDALDAERRIMSPIRLRLSGDRFELVKRMEGMRERIGEYVSQLGAFRVRMGVLVTEKAEEFRLRIEREKKLLSLYDGEIAEQERVSERVAGGVAFETYKRVQGKFYDLVIGADRGLAEIVWREKEKRATRVKQLRVDRKTEIKGLEEEFQDVMRDE